MRHLPKRRNAYTPILCIECCSRHPVVHRAPADGLSVLLLMV
jgi:hypothetical protein